jgi:mono/diheme cytochrome c family protein
MKIIARTASAVLLLLALSTSRTVVAQEPKKTKVADSGAIERGKYIVESVAMCGRCHTPWNQNGEGKRENWLLGGPTQIQASYPVPNWAVVEPRLAGRPPGTDEEFIRLLTTGISRTGARLNPPMPQFRMTRPDAEAVLAYLKSLKQ